jgi:peptidoglycan hydrolase-like protein with peptidoglycan-binding domain
MKRTIANLAIALCVVASVRADQTIQSVQQALTDQGFYYGNVTGDKSAETTAAIRRYQIRNGLQVTGEINPETLRALNVNSNSASPPRITSKSPVTQSSTLRPDDASRAGSVSPARSVGEPDRRVETNQDFTATPYESAPARLNAGIVAEVKRQLANRGYYRGRINGRYGRRAASAVRAFQSRSGIPPTGRLDTRTLDTLGLSAENFAYLESTSSSSGSWVRGGKKFKHGKWKVKWKKQHRGDGDEYGDQIGEGNDDGRWQNHGDDHDD